MGLHFTAAGILYRIPISWQFLSRDKGILTFVVYWDCHHISNKHMKSWNHQLKMIKKRVFILLKYKNFGTNCQTTSLIYLPNTRIIRDEFRIIIDVHILMLYLMFICKNNAVTWWHKNSCNIMVKIFLLKCKIDIIIKSM